MPPEPSAANLRNVSYRLALRLLLDAVADPDALDPAKRFALGMARRTLAEPDVAADRALAVLKAAAWVADDHASWDEFQAALAALNGALAAVGSEATS